ncbi:MAG: RNA-directed DNA polymerase [Planctomycetia bacterium]|nr:RNA-directed DNA polymerase [Planctomycetia bacterium]
MGFIDWLRDLFLGPEFRPKDRSQPPPQRPGAVPDPVFPPRNVAIPGQNPLAQRPAPAPRTPPPPPRKLNLTAAAFAPISDAEAKKQGEAARSAFNPWWGRRDLIPPPDDPRTLVIDRSMVAHGFITPQELTGIHDVGRQMEELRPDLNQVEAQANQAVLAAQADREELKKRKKAEAAEKKRRHAEDVLRRRSTDIVFLGRGVSKGLSDRRANVEKLQAAGLPVLATPADVARALGLTVPRLRWLAFHTEASPVTHYVRFEIPKKSGGMRALAAPHRDMARCQQWILANILGKVAPHAVAHGFVKGRSTLTNAAPHCRRDVVVNADLRDFFPTITFPRVLGIFAQLGYSPAAATVLALLATESPRRPVEVDGTTYHVACGPRALPQGACTSPALSNLAARGLDRRLAAIATKLGWIYSRYADDLTFSTSGEAKTGYLLARLRHIARDEGFTVNEDKTRVQRRSDAQSVTGIVVNEFPSTPRKERRRLRAAMHKAKTSGLAPKDLARARGMAAYVAMVNPAQGAKFAALR